MLSITVIANLNQFDVELEPHSYQPWYDEENQVGRREVYDERRKEGLYIIDPTTTQVMSASRVPARMAIDQTVIEKGNDLSISE